MRGNGIIKLERGKNPILLANRDIIVGKNVPGQAFRPWTCGKDDWSELAFSMVLSSIFATLEVQKGEHLEPVELPLSAPRK
jgi:hypothetical protein